MNKTFNVLLENINSQLTILSTNGYKIYDEENPEFYIKEVYYNEEDDQIYFGCEEDKK